MSDITKFNTNDGYLVKELGNIGLSIKYDLTKNKDAYYNSSNHNVIICRGNDETVLSPKADAGIFNYIFAHLYNPSLVNTLLFAVKVQNYFVIEPYSNNTGLKVFTSSYVPCYETAVDMNPAIKEACDLCHFDYLSGDKVDLYSVNEFNLS